MSDDNWAVGFKQGYGRGGSVAQKDILYFNLPKLEPNTWSDYTPLLTSDIYGVNGKISLHSPMIDGLIVIWYAYNTWVTFPFMNGGYITLRCCNASGETVVDFLGVSSADPRPIVFSLVQGNTSVSDKSITKMKVLCSSESAVAVFTKLEVLYVPKISTHTPEALAT